MGIYPTVRAVLMILAIKKVKASHTLHEEASSALLQLTQISIQGQADPEPNGSSPNLTVRL